MNLVDRVEKTPVADLLRGMTGSAAQCQTELEAGSATVATHGNKHPPRLAKRESGPGLGPQNNSDRSFCHSPILPEQLTIGMSDLGPKGSLDL